jgi:hypothetical protein
MLEISVNSFNLSHLIPVSEFVSGFTTSTHIYHEKLQHITLADKELGVHKVTSSTMHRLVKPPPTSTSNAPSSAWEAVYPKGSINPSAPIPGGFGFYLSGPTMFAKRLETASEVIFSYRMMLQDGWEWVKGGKLPGVCKSCDLA